MHPGTDIIRQLGYVLLAVLQAGVFVLSAYQSVMSLFGFWQRRKPPLKDPVTRFAVLVAALLLEKVKPKYWWGVFMFAVYGLTWVPLDFIALFTRNGQTWFHTIHKQAASSFTS